jgi:hypothetical protein
MSFESPQQTCLAHLEKTARLKRKLYALEKQSPYGPVETERMALDFNQLAIARKLDTLPQNLNQFLQRLKRGAVTIKSLRKVANALNCDCQLVMVPRGQGSVTAWAESAKANQQEEIPSVVYPRPTRRPLTKETYFDGTDDSQE